MSPFGVLRSRRMSESDIAGRPNVGTKWRNPRIEPDASRATTTTVSAAWSPATESIVIRADTESDREHPRGSETILLVDDEEAVLEFARRTLVSCGYTVLAAHSGVEALAHARATPRIDVLLTDVLMPQLSGPQLVERYLEKYPVPCIMYMTGFVDDETMRLELDEEVLLLRKPFSAAVLARTVRSAIDARRTPPAGAVVQ